MKIAHSLRSAEHISQRELERVLKGSLGNNFTVDEFQMEQMITGIMKVHNYLKLVEVPIVGRCRPRVNWLLVQ